MTNTRENLIELLRNTRHEYRRYIAMKDYEKRIAKTDEEFLAVDDSIVGEIPFCADQLIANGVTVQEWIPVTERLPQEDLPFGALCEVVQVLLNDGSVTIGWCNRGLRLWFHMPIRETKIVGYEYEKTPVIAWQPLSQPPSAAKNE